MMLKARKATKQANLTADEATQKAKNAADSAAYVHASYLAFVAAAEQPKATKESSQLAGVARQAVLEPESEQFVCN